MFADALQQSWPIQNLEAEGNVGDIIATYRVQSPLRVVQGNIRKQSKVVVNDASGDWHRCDVDDVAARVVEVKQETEKPFFVKEKSLDVFRLFFLNRN